MEKPVKLSLEQVYNACHRFIWHMDSTVKIVHTPTERRYIISNNDVWGAVVGFCTSAFRTMWPKAPRIKPDTFYSVTMDLRQDGLLQHITILHMRWMNLHQN